MGYHRALLQSKKIPLYLTSRSLLQALLGQGLAFPGLIADILQDNSSSGFDRRDKDYSQNYLEEDSDKNNCFDRIAEVADFAVLFVVGGNFDRSAFLLVKFHQEGIFFPCR